MATVTIPIEKNLPTNTPMDLGDYLSKGIGVVLTIAAVATFGFLIWGGIEWITAGGEEKKIEQARNRITGAIVGLAVVALSWAIFLIINTFFGLNVVK